MPNSAQRPVVFLAFANDRDDSVGYLRNLPDEARRLREVLEPAERAGLCEIVVRSNCTAADIFKVFQDSRYRNRIAILHYGGHANGYQLLLESASGESAAANAGGLARFLGQQQGLHLVFLNGCSTQHQTDGLLQAGIAAVVSTSRAIDDKVAVEFACQFYQGLAGGAAIRTAYNEAEAAVHTASGGNTRGLYFGSKDHSKSQIDVYRWPWDLFLRHGSETADEWNLPEAVNDPMFGLPPLPERDLPESPYRYLSWFRREDAEVFFGRGHEIRKLYGLITTGAQPIILFYGQSGVGKSSLLDAGLLPRLEQTCEVAYLRRRSSGLLATLKQALLPQASTLPIEKAWLAKEQELRKPLVVFLDQVEEFYTQPIEGMADELSQLLRTAKAIFGNPKNRPGGKLVLGFRKEWLAELESQMTAHELPRAKVSLEPLSHTGIIEVVNGPTRTARLRERYGLTVDDGVAEAIARDMLKDRGSAVSTTLQIVLSEMWSRAQAVNPESPRFTQADYDVLEHSGVLSKFFDQQLKEFESRSKPAADSGLLLDVLALHTTDLSSANECSREKLLEQYSHVKNELSSLLKECQNLYLLTETGHNQTENSHSTRLAHDTLAPLVRDKFDKSDKPGQRARRILDNRSVDWRENASGPPLDEADLKMVELGISGTRALNSDELRLLGASCKLQSRMQRNRRNLKFTGVAAFVAITVLGVFGWLNYSDAKSSRDTLKTTNGELTNKTKAAVDAQKKAAKTLAESARTTAMYLRDEKHDWLAASHYFLTARDGFLEAEIPDRAAQMNIALSAINQISLLDSLTQTKGLIFDVQIVDGKIAVCDGGTYTFWSITADNAGRKLFGKITDGDHAKLAPVFPPETRESRSFSKPSQSSDPEVLEDRLIFSVQQKTNLEVIHAEMIKGVQYSPDRNLGLSWSADYDLWELTSLRFVQNEATNEFRFSVVGGRTYDNSKEGMACVWHRASGTMIASIRLPNIQGAVFYDDTTFLTWTQFGTIQLWEIQKGGRIPRIDESAPSLNSPPDADIVVGHEGSSAAGYAKVSTTHGVARLTQDLHIEGANHVEKGMVLTYSRPLTTREYAIQIGAPPYLDPDRAMWAEVSLWDPDSGKPVANDLRSPPGWLVHQAKFDIDHGILFAECQSTTKENWWEHETDYARGIISWRIGRPTGPTMPARSDLEFTTGGSLDPSGDFNFNTIHDIRSE